MLTDRPRRPPFIQPYLRALDRLESHQQFLEADALKRRAEEMAGSGASVGFAYAPTGILAEHTHYFEGFALLMPLPLGIAVGITPSTDGRTHIVFEGDRATWIIEPGEAVDDSWPGWVRLVYEVVSMLTPGEALRVAVVSTVFSECFDAYVSALTVACARAALSLGEGSIVERRTIRDLRTSVEETTGVPFSAAYLIAAFHGTPAKILLVDAATFEYLPVETPGEDEVVWCLVQAGTGPVSNSDYYHGMKLAAARAIDELQAAAFPELVSFRELEHRHLDRALSEVSEPRKPIVRHLVTENRRVQKMVVALRKGDWQFAGALLLMSHASLANDWKSTSADVDRVVAIAERMSIEGVHGACMTSRGGSVLVLGRRFVISQLLEHIEADFRANRGYEPTSIVLESESRRTIVKPPIPDDE